MLADRQLLQQTYALRAIPPSLTAGPLPFTKPWAATGLPAALSVLLRNI